MERKIGEIFEFAGRKLRVEKAKHGSCDGCYFLERKCLEKVHGECCDDYRMTVLFIAVMAIINRIFKH